MTNSIGCEEQVWKTLMTNVVEKEHECPQQSSAESFSGTTTVSRAISYLAESKTSGLAMLVEKLLSEAKNNTFTRHLISALINRLHYNSIIIHASTDDNVEDFILKMITTATRFTQANEPNRPSTAKAANLLTSAIQKYDMKQVDSGTLEYEWKEFLFHFYRSRLKEWAP